MVRSPSNNELFYDALAETLQSPAAQFGPNLYYYGQTSEGRHFKLTDYPGMFLDRPVEHVEERRKALQEGRAWLTLQEGTASLRESDTNLIGHEYSIVRLGGIATSGMGGTIARLMREASEEELPLDVPIIYATDGNQSREVVSDLLAVPFLAEVYRHVAGHP